MKAPTDLVEQRNPVPWSLDVKMRSITQWNPFKEMDDLQQRISATLGWNPANRSAVRSGDENMTLPDWAPLVDIAEDEREYLIKFELPEVQREDVKVTVEGGTLTVSGERRAEKEEKGRRYHRVERAYGQFARSFVFPEDADPAKVAAEFKHGVLHVRLAKSERALPKQIEVKVS